MLFTLGVTVLWTALKMNHVSSLPITAFAVTGYSTILLWRNMPGRLICSVEPNLALMYHRDVKVIDIYTARLMLEFMGATTSFIVLTIIFCLVGWMELPEDLFQVVVGWLLLAWFGAALAIFLGSFSEDYDVIEKLWHPAAYLIMPLSGAGFIVSSLPDVGQKYILYMPMINAVEYVREGFFGSLMHAKYDLGYLIIFNSILTVLGLAKMAKIAREVIPQ